MQSLNIFLLFINVFVVFVNFDDIYSFNTIHRTPFTLAISWKFLILNIWEI